MKQANTIDDAERRVRRFCERAGLELLPDPWFRDSTWIDHARTLRVGRRTVGLTEPYPNPNRGFSGNWPSVVYSDCEPPEPVAAIAVMTGDFYLHSPDCETAFIAITAGDLGAMLELARMHGGIRILRVRVEACRADVA